MLLELLLIGIIMNKKIISQILRYNSHPEHNYLDEQLFKDHKMKNMVIIGNGNVAIDVARIFSKKVDELKSTDINEKVLELRNVNPTENVFLQL